MAGFALAGDTSGQLAVNAPAVAGSNTLTLQAATATNAVNTLATAQASTSGTFIDFTGLPNWIKRITVIFSGVSTNGTSIPQIQIGSGSALTTGYVGQTWLGNTTNAAHSTGFLISGATLSTYAFYGHAILTNLTGNSWVFSIAAGATGAGNAITGGGSNTTLSGALDRVRITTVNGTDTFDAGTINILYEG
jgi:hypothetical protein